MNPLISIILPVLNDNKYLSRCLRSILSQITDNYELLLVSDDNSESIKICEDVAKKTSNIFFINSATGGIGAAKNRALQEAKGAYIFFINPSDYLSNNALDELFHFITEHEADLYVMNVKVQSDRPLKGWEETCLESKFFHLRTITEDEIFNVNSLNDIYKTHIFTNNRVYKKNVIDNYGIKFPENSKFDDFVFYFKYIISVKEAYYITKKIYNFWMSADRPLPASYKAKSWDMVRSYIDGALNIQDFFVEKSDHPEQKKILVKIFEYYMHFAIAALDSDHEKNKIIEYAYKKVLERRKKKFSREILLNYHFKKFNNKIIGENIYWKNGFLIEEILFLGIPFYKVRSNYREVSKKFLVLPFQNKILKLRLR